MNWLKWFALVVFCLSSVLACSGPMSHLTFSWAAYYSDRPAGGSLSSFDLVVLDPDYHPPLPPLLKQNKTVLAYLSLGEVETFRSYFDAVEAQGLLLGTSPLWKESRFVDLRDKRWARRVISDLLPAILAQGFDGVLLDTLDSAIYLEEQDAEQFRGMRQAAVRLALEIRRNYPSIQLAMNRAFPLLSQLEQVLDYELAESLYGGYDFEQNRYRPQNADDARQWVAELQAAMARNPALKILTLDYWDPRDSEGIEVLYAKQLKHGFHPYVATIKLDRIP